MILKMICLIMNWKKCDGNVLQFKYLIILIKVIYQYGEGIYDLRFFNSFDPDWFIFLLVFCQSCCYQNIFWFTIPFASLNSCNEVAWNARTINTHFRNHLHRVNEDLLCLKGVVVFHYYPSVIVNSQYFTRHYPHAWMH